MTSYTIELDLPADTDAASPLALLRDQDVVIYSGPISPYLDRNLGTLMHGISKKSNVLLLLTTLGGDADAAYRTAKLLRRRYGRYALGVLGECKSAGTLIALGANSIVMSESGELGPLDVQVFSPDEFVQQTSGMTISQALSFLSSSAFDTFEEMFLAIRRKSGGIITTQTAAEIATSMVTGLFSPITAKLDPARVGEMQMSLDIAVAYGRRLGARPKTVTRLVHGYPSHSFVIDFEEAKELFPGVREPAPAEKALFAYLSKVLTEECGRDHLAIPADDGFAAIVEVPDADDVDSEEGSDASADESATDHAPSGERSMPEGHGSAATREDSAATGSVS